jgi:hypothetical protein
MWDVLYTVCQKEFPWMIRHADTLLNSVFGAVGLSAELQGLSTDTPYVAHPWVALSGVASQTLPNSLLLYVLKE